MHADQLIVNPDHLLGFSFLVLGQISSDRNHLRQPQIRAVFLEPCMVLAVFGHHLFHFIPKGVLADGIDCVDQLMHHDTVEHRSRGHINRPIAGFVPGPSP